MGNTKGNSARREGFKDDEALIIDTRTSERKRIKINQLTDFLSV